MSPDEDLDALESRLPGVIFFGFGATVGSISDPTVPLSAGTMG